MIRILFVCYGNICRSPMAEFLLRSLLEQRGLQERFAVASAATSDEELGNGVYPPIRELLSKRGISTRGKTAVQLKASDYAAYDYIIGMDGNNLRHMQRLFGGDPEGKLSLLLGWAGQKRDVADPWYTRDFVKAEEDILLGCTALLEKLTEA